MEQNLRQKEFLGYFKKLKEQEDLCLTSERSEQPFTSYTYSQFIALKKYKDYLWNFFLWKYNDLYLELFVRFLNYEISGDEFSEEFITLRFSHIKKFDQLLKELEMNFQAVIDLPVDSKAFNFSRIISQVYEDCDAFVSDECLESIEDTRDASEIDENELRTRIKESILKFPPESFPE